MNGEERSDELLARARRLDREVPPARDLWPEIRARIEESGSPRITRPARRVWVPAALAASVAVAAAALVLLRGPAPDAPPVASGQAPVAAAIPASFGPLYTLGAPYEDARRSLAGDLEERLAELSPETRAVVTRNLAAIQAAVAEINAALADDPGNVFLQQLLLDTYHDELAVLANVRRMTETLSNPQRNEI